MNKHILTTILLAPLTLQAQESVEERLSLLEKRVSELEAKRTPSDKKPLPTATNSVAESKPAYLFSDDFESGVKAWKEEVKIYPAYLSSLKGAELRFAKEYGNIVSFTKWRVAKCVTYEDTKIRAKEGKRFLTAANFEGGKSKITCTMSKTSGWSKKWLGVHYLSTAKSLDLSSLSLPIVQFSAYFDPVVEDSKTYGVFQCGYVYEGNTTSQFIPVMTLKSQSKGWQDYEIDLSEVDTSKKIRLVFMYAQHDQRFATSSGLHLDNIVLKNDE